MKNQIAFEFEGLSALSSVELTNTFGGGWWSDFKEGFKEGWNWAKNAVVSVAAVIAVVRAIR